MGLATAPQTEQTPPHSLAYAQLKKERDQAVGRVQYLEHSVVNLQKLNAKLQGRIDERAAKERWRTTLHAVPTKTLGPSEKLVLEDLYAVFRGRANHGCDPNMALGMQCRAKKIGLSDTTYRRSVETLAKIGALELTKLRDEETGRKRFLAKPMTAFWAPATIARKVERDYGYRERRCPAHPTADIIKTSTVHVARVTVTTTTTTYKCTQCKKTVSRETLRSEDEPETQSSKTTHTTVSNDGEIASCPLREGTSLNHESEKADVDPAEEAFRQVVETPSPTQVAAHDENTGGGATEAPAWLSPRLGDIPQELLNRPQWAAWRAVERDRKWIKPPMNPRTGELASVTDPATWGTVSEAMGARSRHGADGIGFMFTADDPYTAVDLDQMDDQARDIITTLDSYTELSPSGRGVHILVGAAKPAGWCKQGLVEMYDRARFLTITGHLVPDSVAVIRDRQDELNLVHQRLSPPVLSSPSTSAPRLSPVAVDDASVIDELTRANYPGIQFEPLWRGDTSEVAGDNHRADFHLCRHLAFGTGGDPPRVDRLWRQSGLATPERRAKWDARHRADGATYGEMTVGRAIQDAPKRRGHDA